MLKRIRAIIITIIIICYHDVQGSDPIFGHDEAKKSCQEKCGVNGDCKRLEDSKEFICHCLEGYTLETATNHCKTDCGFACLRQAMKERSYGIGNNLPQILIIAAMFIGGILIFAAIYIVVHRRKTSSENPDEQFLKNLDIRHGRSAHIHDGRFKLKKVRPESSVTYSALSRDDDFEESDAFLSTPNSGIKLDDQTQPSTNRPQLAKHRQTKQLSWRPNIDRSHSETSFESV